MALDHPEDALAPGSHVGEYEILRVLGRGGFGVTYAARSRGQSGTMVAIKELFPVGMCVRESGGRVIPSSETDRGDLDLANDMFCRESQIICTIHHINLVRGIEWISQNNTGYLVMQYASGKNLHEHIRARRGSFQVSPITVAQLCRGVLAGLSTLHGNGICHCDIKPDNIFLGVGFEPILIDLGSACLPIHQGSSSAITYSRHYSAIEQIDDRFGKIGPWTDIYQFSAVLYRCLSGGKLPDAIDRASSQSDPFVPLADLDVISPGFPKSFLDAIDFGLNRFPKDRPESIMHWRRLLDPVLDRMAPPKIQRPKSPERKRRIKPPVHQSSHAETDTPSLQTPAPSSPSKARAPAEGIDPLARIGQFLLVILGIIIFMILLRGCEG